jgi:putative transposase
MKNLGQRFVQYVNRTYQRSGTLWEGRFRSSIVQERGYLLRCYRYIELNPVRAGITRQPQDYRWSSYRVNAGLAASQLITPHEEYLALGRSKEERVTAYRGLFEAEMGPADLNELRSATNGGFVWGDERFKAEVAGMLGRRVEMGAPGRPRKQDRAKPGTDHVFPIGQITG